MRGVFGMDVGALAAGWGYIGIIEREAEKAWQQTGKDVFGSLVDQYSEQLHAMAEVYLDRNPKGGRPNKHSEKLFRSTRPEQEHFLPHGLDRWHRPTESY